MNSLQQFFAAVRDLERRLDREPAVPPLALVTPERMREQLAAGLPLLPLVPPVIPVDAFLEDLAAYRALLIQFQPDLGVELGAQAAAVAGAGTAVRARLVQVLMHGDTAGLLEVADTLGVAPERLYFLGELALRPYLEVYAQRLESVVDMSGYHEGRCPVCGRMAHLGHIDVDNVKHLHCPACETIWRFGRVECANCGCTDPAKVGYFTVEGDDELRVEHCTECGHYLKVINQRVRARAFDPLLEDAATLHLDQLAEAEGYRKGGNPDRSVMV